jgi:hypothetical protein
MYGIVRVIGRSFLVLGSRSTALERVWCRWLTRGTWRLRHVRRLPANRGKRRPRFSRSSIDIARTSTIIDHNRSQPLGRYYLLPACLALSSRTTFDWAVTMVRVAILVLTRHNHNMPTITATAWIDGQGQQGGTTAVAISHRVVIPLDAL